MLFFFFFILMVLHVFNTPYSKVEESFNLQAIHDILYHTTNLSKYDHLEFPGVVPRSFVGPILVSSLSAPFVHTLDYFNINKSYSQIVVRCMLGLLICLAFSKFYKSIVHYTKKPAVAKLMVVLTMTQFHFLFYASRTLPNTFALMIVLLGIASWLENENNKFIWYSATVILIFRAELCILMGFLLIIKLYEKEISILQLLVQGMIAGAVALGATILVDSYFWQRLLWPEGEVLYYNTVLNKSSDYGTSPFLWYFYSALPRALLFSVIFLPLGLSCTRYKKLHLLTHATLLYVFVYSFLPHKELRFIIYVFPVFNAQIAVAVFKVLHWFRQSPTLRKLFSLILAGVLIGNVSLTLLLSYISHHNYPGGVAFHKLHSTSADTSHDVNVHICNMAAQTGVTRFGEVVTNWRKKVLHKTLTSKIRYFKDENIIYPHKLGKDNFTYMIVEHPCIESMGFAIQTIIKGFNGIKIEKTFPFINIDINEKLCIMKYNAKS